MIYIKTWFSRNCATLYFVDNPFDSEGKGSICLSCDTASPSLEYYVQYYVADVRNIICFCIGTLIEPD